MLIDLLLYAKTLDLSGIFIYSPSGYGRPVKIDERSAGGY
jgi:hypothetical protein